MVIAFAVAFTVAVADLNDEDIMTVVTTFPYQLPGSVVYFCVFCVMSVVSCRCCRLICALILRAHGSKQLLYSTCELV